MQNSRLWEKIERFDLDEMDAAFPFSERLMRENGWTAAYAYKAIDAYKRFAYLAIVSKTPVTPSDAVDQVWHLHLVYTRNYWDEFCAVLGKPLHHGPTKGGKTEHQKFHVQYQETLDMYEREFATKPPIDIWPDVEARFASTGQFVRLNSTNYWLLPKAKGIQSWGMVLLGGVLVALVFAATIVLAQAAKTFGSAFGVIAVVSFAIAVIVIILSRSKKKNLHGGGCAGGCGGCGG